MWNIQAARSLYNLSHWSNGYFEVTEQGTLAACPRPDRPHQVDLHRLTAEIREQGLNLPVLVRFSDILHDRVDRLTDAFAAAMAERDYRGRYTAVYPIKVNQQRRVVEEIVTHGGPRVGLEAGSKPELMAVLALADRNGGVIVCNGYKDREYIRLALIGRALGHRLHIVIEKLSELEIVIRESQEMGIEPLLGVRLRLSSLGAGKWQNSGGEKAKFGLSAAQVLEAVERLKKNGLLHTLKLIHFHMGSQLSNIHDVQRGMREAVRYYAELRRLGAEITIADVGGGLGIDYEGTHSRSYCSVNYSVEEYARNIVHTLWEACSERELPHPDIITECGRAMTAHHAVLITNVTDTDGPPGDDCAEPPTEGAPLLLHEMHRTLQALDGHRAAEGYHDALHWLSQSQELYTAGTLSLEHKAHAERLYFAIARRVAELLNPRIRAHAVLLDELNERLADKYFCNLSIFQSLPDVWGIEQIFPILPLHRLDEEPTRRAVIEDLTCDSDGRIDQFVEQAGIESTLALHHYTPGADYLLGIFLVGAYQETLGDIHNLFGDTDSVDVLLNAEGGYRLVHPEHGDTVEELLRLVHYNPRELAATYRAKTAASDLSPIERSRYLNELEAGLSGYTYLEE
ncbi:biosynthetic arginine decarboxylase [Endothiovibrio diazotrophicus]